MVDVGTGLTALGTAQVTKDMIGKMLGPTAEYIGDGVRSWSERRTQNVQRVFEKASRRLGDEIDRPGAVPPRVLKAVLDEAQVADDELIAEYLGGVLASSRTESGRDDRAASAARLVAGLSTYAIRTHYLFYASARRHFVGTDSKRLRVGDSGETRVYLTTMAYMTAMEFSDSEQRDYFGILSDTLLSLDRHNLLASWVSGDPEHLRSAVLNKAFPENGLTFEVTQQGVSLFCIASGVGGNDPFASFVDAKAALVIEYGPQLPDTAFVDELPLYSDPNGPGNSQDL